MIKKKKIKNKVEQVSQYHKHQHLSFKSKTKIIFLISNLNPWKIIMFDLNNKKFQFLRENIGQYI